jgi:hypothetical protein
MEALLTNRFEAKRRGCQHDRSRRLEAMRPGALARVLAIAALLAACTGAQRSTTPAQSSSAGGSSAPGGASGPLATVAAVSTAADDVPAPTLTDPAQIDAALFDPSKVDVGVVSLLAQLGIGIDGDDGTPLRPPSGSAFPDFHLRVAEVRGLIDMGRTDASAIAKGQVPWTLTDLTGALTPLLPGLSEQDVLDRYIAAYRAAPGDLVREVLNGHPLLVVTPFTRVHLWLLLVDGVLGRHGPAAAAAGSIRLAAFRETAAGPVATVGLPLIPSPIPGLDARDFAIVMAHLPVLGYQVPITLSITPGKAHEGHGGVGPLVAIDARQDSVPSPLVSVVDGHPLLIPIRAGLDGVPISFESADSGTLDAHGILQGQLGVPILTDAGGVAHLGYQLLPEEANGVGDLTSTVAGIDAVVDLRQMLLSQYVVDPSILLAVWGTRRAPGTLVIEWHEAPVPTGNENGTYDVTLGGPKAGAGHQVGAAEIYCTATPNVGRLLWSATAIPAGAKITQIVMQQNPSGWDSLQVTTTAQAEFDPWVAQSNLAGETAKITVSGSGDAIRIEGHGSLTDSAGHVFTIAIVVSCSTVDQ